MVSGQIAVCLTIDCNGVSEVVNVKVWRLPPLMKITFSVKVDENATLRVSDFRVIGGDVMNHPVVQVCHTHDERGVF